MAAYFIYGSTEKRFREVRAFGVDFIDGTYMGKTIGTVEVPMKLKLESLETRRTILKEVEKLVFKWNPVMKECPVILDMPRILPRWTGKVWRI
jgi:hypothetical protein